jgi:membrane dipeptidase
MPDGDTSNAASVHSNARVVDLHAHPSMKTYLFKRRLHDCHRSGRTLDPWALRVDLPKLRQGGVDVLLHAIYSFEEGLFSDCFPLKVVRLLAPSHWKLLFKGSSFDRTVDLIEHFERVVAESEPVDGCSLRLANSRAELEQVLRDGNLAVLHSVEGAHSLGGTAENVRKLFDMGVCLMTLAHFYENGVAYPVPGIPPSMRFLGCFSRQKDLSKGLTELGHDVIEEMLRLGMLIDLTHCTPVARREALEQVRNQAPIVMSHVGVHALNPVPMNPTDEEIEKIADGGGVIGVIFMNAWLSPGQHAEGIELIADTIFHIRDVGGVDAVALGSDFDGFTDPPDDLKDPSVLPGLTARLLSRGLAQGEVEEVLGGNALRVIREGWGR